MNWNPGMIVVLIQEILERQIHDAVFYVFSSLISADFLASDYCNDVEPVQASRKSQ